jgi:hypothetical protein
MYNLQLSKPKKLIFLVQSWIEVNLLVEVAVLVDAALLEPLGVLRSISSTSLCAAHFICADPKSVKIQSSCQYLFVLLGSSCVKAARELLVKLIPCPSDSA